MIFLLLIIIEFNEKLWLILFIQCKRCISTLVVFFTFNEAWSIHHCTTITVIIARSESFYIIKSSWYRQRMKHISLDSMLIRIKSIKHLLGHMVHMTLNILYWKGQMGSTSLLSGKRILGHRDRNSHGKFLRRPSLFHSFFQTEHGHIFLNLNFDKLNQELYMIYLVINFPLKRREWNKILPAFAVSSTLTRRNSVLYIFKVIAIIAVRIKVGRIFISMKS